MTKDQDVAIADLCLGIYEFLLKCRVHYEEDGEIHHDGSMTDHSQYHMSCKPEAMDQLAVDMGIYPRERETAWQAIQRSMERQVNAQSKEAEDQAKVVQITRGVSQPVK